MNSPDVPCSSNDIIINNNTHDCKKVSAGAASRRLRLLVLSDVDIASAISLAEHFVPASPPSFDAIVVCGPLSSSSSSSSPEAEAVATADMASAVAHLENIACRVLYVPGDQDPPRASSEQLHLTPNSVNLHARSLPLHRQLFVAGFSERALDLTAEEAPALSSEGARHSGGEEEEEEDGEEEEGIMQRQTSSSSTIVEEILSQSAACCLPSPPAAAAPAVSECECESAPSPPPPPCGIFVFNYKFAHRLNHFLFFQTELARRARLRLLVVPSLADTNFEFPREHNNYTIASPRSLRLEGSYTTVELELRQGGGGGGGEESAWGVTHMQDHTLTSVL
jgi:hypothetical protein